MAKREENLSVSDMAENIRVGNELVSAIVKAVLAKGGNGQHLRRIAKEPALQRAIADLIIPTDLALGADEYIVHVDYRVPGKARVMREFDLEESDLEQGFLNSMFYDEKDYFQVELHPSCERVDLIPSEHIMLVKRFDRDIGCEDAVVEMDDQGYRPAMYLEAFSFVKENPDMLYEFDMVALGSCLTSSIDPNNKGFMELFSDGCMRGIAIHEQDEPIDSRMRALFVRKNRK